MLSAYSDIILAVLPFSQFSISALEGRSICEMRKLCWQYCTYFNCYCQLILETVNTNNYHNKNKPIRAINIFALQNSGKNKCSERFDGINDQPTTDPPTDGQDIIL